MPKSPNILRATQRAVAYAKLDAIEGAAEMTNDRLVGLAETSYHRVSLWRRERGIPPPPGTRPRMTVSGIEPPDVSQAGSQPVWDKQQLVSVMYSTWQGGMYPHAGRDVHRRPNRGKDLVRV